MTFFQSFIDEMQQIFSEYAVPYFNHNKTKLIFHLADGGKNKKFNRDLITESIQSLENILIDKNNNALYKNLTIFIEATTKPREISQRFFNLPLTLGASLAEFKVIYDLLYHGAHQNDNYQYQILSAMNFTDNPLHRDMALYVIEKMPPVEDKHYFYFTQFITKCGFDSSVVPKIVAKFYQKDSQGSQIAVSAGNIHMLHYLNIVAMNFNIQPHSLIKEVFPAHEARDFSMDENLASLYIKVPKSYIEFNCITGHTSQEFIGFIQESLENHIKDIDLHSVSVAHSEVSYDFTFYGEQSLNHDKIKRFLKGFILDSARVIEEDRHKNGMIKKNTFRKSLDKVFLKHALDYNLNHKEKLKIKTGKI